MKKKSTIKHKSIFQKEKIDDFLDLTNEKNQDFVPQSKPQKTIHDEKKLLEKGTKQRTIIGDVTEPRLRSRFPKEW